MKTSAVTTDPVHLMYDADELAAARTIAVFVPGALARLDIFDAALCWRDRGYGLAFYRFPGLDGRPVAPALNIAEAAAEIVALARRYPNKPLRLLGYSTGGPIVLTAAAQIPGDVRIAAMSPAVEHGGGLVTGLRGLVDLARATWRARSLRLSRVWYSYYQTLWFGRAVHHDPALRQRAEAVVAARRCRIVLPDGGKARAHTDDLRHWRLSPVARFDADRLRIFCGIDDPVFSQRQTLRFAHKLGAAVTGYPGQGHLLFASHPAVFEDVFSFFEGAVPALSEGIELRAPKSRGAGAGNSD